MVGPRVSRVASISPGPRLGAGRGGRGVQAWTVSDGIPTPSRARQPTAMRIRRTVVTGRVSDAEPSRATSPLVLRGPPLVRFHGAPRRRTPSRTNIEQSARLATQYSRTASPSGATRRAKWISISWSRRNAATGMHSPSWPGLGATGCSGSRNRILRDIGRSEDAVQQSAGDRLARTATAPRSGSVRRLDQPTTRPRGLPRGSQGTPMDRRDPPATGRRTGGAG